MSRAFRNMPYPPLPTGAFFATRRPIHATQIPAAFKNRPPQGFLSGFGAVLDVFPPSHMVASMDDKPPPTPEFKRGWEAALQAARQWHESQASKTMVSARRSRFPKNLEREAEIHRQAAELIVTLSWDDV